MSEEASIVCRLPGEDLRRREATLLAQFKSAMLAVEEFEDGYGFRLSGDGRSLALIADLISAERECCPFLTFELTAAPNLGPLVLRVSGPAPAKEFLKSILL